MRRREPLPVVVTGVGGATLGEQCLRCLRQADTDYLIVGTDLVRESLGLALADIGYVVPYANADGYLDELLDICSRHDVRVLIPTSEAELRVVSAARDRFEERGIFVPINRHELIAAGDDKFRSLEQIDRAGVRTPVHMAADSIEDAAAWTDFPCVIKPALGGSGSANVFIAQSAGELAALAGYLFELSPQVVIEEYVGDPSSEYTVAVLRDMDGRLMHSIAIRRAILGGISNRLRVPNRTTKRELGDVLAISSGVSQGEIADFPEVRSACEALAEGLDSRGPLNIQCRLHAGELVVFEINPRFSGTSFLRALAGFNEPDLLIRKHVLGQEVPTPFEYTFGTVVRGMSEVMYPAAGADAGAGAEDAPPVRRSSRDVAQPQDSLDRVLLTFDVDWASDEIIRECAGILLDQGVKATWLITHDSEAVRELAKHPSLFELGIHPNFLPGSTQGATPEAVLQHMLSIVPAARTVRTHTLMQSTGLLQTMCEDFGIEHDLSLLLPDAPHIVPHEFFLPGGKLTRFPTFWEDDVEMLKPEPTFLLTDPKYHVPGLKIFSFHPVHVALNSCSTEPYERLKATHRVADVAISDLRDYANTDGPGAATFLRVLVAQIASGAYAPGLTVSELSEEWMADRG